MKYGLLMFWIFVGVYLQAQNVEAFRGAWEGEIIQNSGSYAEMYSFEVYINTKASENEVQIFGRTYIEVDSAYAIMSFIGKSRDEKLILEEQEILYSDKPELLSWCFKTLKLALIKEDSEWILRGTWDASSKYGVCLPGQVVLKKVKPQA